MSKTYLGVDIGGTAVKLGLVDENGRVLRRAERSVSFDATKRRSWIPCRRPSTNSDRGHAEA